MVRKKLFEEIDKLDNLNNLISSATFHRVMSSVSPLKRGRTWNYFNGMITDGTKSVWVVRFNYSQQKTVKQFMDSKENVQFSDCEVKQPRKRESMEILLKGSTEIKGSPRKVSLSKLDFVNNTPFDIQLADIDSMNVNDRVLVRVKVLKCCDHVHVSNDKEKQDITIADNSDISNIIIPVGRQHLLGKLQTNQ